MDFSNSKNIARGSFKETVLDDGFLVLTYQNNTNAPETVQRDIDSSFIQFHFCIKGACEFVFNNGNYRLKIEAENSLLLYNPQRDLPIHLEVHSQSWLVTVLVSIKKFHGLFSQEADHITFLSADNKDKKKVEEKKVTSRNN